jgi:FkbM family methyltransferase
MQRIHGIADPNSVQLLADEWAKRNFVDPAFIKSILESGQSSLSPFELQAVFRCFNGSDLSIQSIRDSADRDEPAGLTALSMLEGDMELADPPYTRIRPEAFHRMRNELAVEPDRVSTGLRPEGYPYYVPGRTYSYDIDWVRSTLQDSSESFARLKSERKNDTAVLVGNGPSLNLTDLSLLNGQDVFISNYAIKHPILSEVAKGVAVSNYLVAEQEPHQFQLSPIGAKFFPFWLRNTIVPDDRTIFLNAEGGSLYFSKDVTKRLSWKSTVSYFWLQILYSLGYQKIVMIGFDHSYQQSQTAKEGDVLDQKEDDQNHFDAGYFKGKKWQAADVSNMGETYEISRQFYELDGREIVNCTVGGALEVFRRADLGDELNAGAKISVKSLATTPKIALITPFWSGDVDGAERHWRILNRLGTPSGDHIHLYKHSAELLPPTTLPNVVFADIDTNFPEPAKQPHPSGPNLVFAHTVKMLADSGYTHFFWLEPDCVPTKPDWLEPFADAAAAHPDAPIIGVGGGTTSPDAPHWRHHFAGCSLYNIEQLNKIDWDDFIANDLDVSFDVWLSAKLGYIQVLGEDDGDNQGTIIFGASRHHWRLLERPDPVVTGMFEHWRPEKFLSKTQLQAFVDSGNFGMFHAIKDPQLQNHIYRSTKRSASTIIINYNNELYLKEAIDSALQQEDLGQTSYEVIVVDDGSSDSSTSIIAAYGDRIRPVYLEHGQLNGNFNQQRALLKALEIATGDVILLLDGDDTFSDRKVSTVLSAFDDATAVLVQHPLDMVNIAGEALGQSSKSFSRIGRQHTPELYTDTRQTNYFQPTSGLAFRRSYLRAISRFLKPDQFHRTWLDVRCTRPAVFYGKVITLGDSLGQWRRHEESDSIGTDNLWLRMVEHHDWFNQSGLPMTQPTLYIGGDHETKLRTTTRFCALDENNNLRFTADKRVVLAGGSEPIAVDVSGFNRSRIALCIPADSPDLSGVLESNLVDVVIDANYITAMLSKKTETGYDFKLAAKYVFVTFSSGTLDQKTRTSIQAACSGKVFFVHVDDHKNQVLQSVCEELTEALGYGPRFSAANPKDVDDLKKAISLVPELCFVSAEAKRLAPMFLAGQAGTRHAPSPPSVKPRSSRALTAAEQSEYDTVTASLPIQGDIFLPTDKIPPQDRLAGVKKIRALYDGQLDSIYRPRLRALKDRFVNRKRCFIIGNGPSLSHTDLDQLKDEVTFATNGFFLKAEELGWAPTLYIVEDHLVAEDRAAEIHELKAWTKLFPANLSYIIEPDDNTIFFDHRPRPSFPHGFDFSFDADVNTFAGGTVVYTCMQLAAYLGFEEIYLVGVDADYSIPEDAKYSGNGRVKELDMDSDDTNHFHPDYFGKGKRWHEPNVDVMLGAYKEAKQQCFARGVIIKNATLGGKLEVFPRADFSSLFRDVPKFPKLLIIDPTRLGDGTATGQLKESLMQEWAPENLMQVYNAGKRHVGVASYRGDEVFRPTLIRGLGELLKRTQKFSPEIVLYRPVPESPDLHRAAMHLIEKLDIPLATWIVDDWPTAIETGNKSLKRFDAQVRRLLKTSAARLSISPSMSHAFEARYGVQFVDIANGVDPDDWPIPELTRPTGPIKVRYAGSLATNMSLASVLLIAKAVESLSTDGIDITFEIKTRAIWHDRAAHEFSDFKRTTLLLPDGEIEDYRAWLSGADIVTIAYNFDDRSKSYIKYSQANKLPECLASGAALLAVGPEDVATMSLLQKLDCSTLVTQESCKVVGNALRELSASPEARHQLATKAQNVAFERFDLTQAQDKFSNILRAAAGMEEPNTVPRSKHAQVDETAVVAELLKERKGRDKIMLDVGAHFGTSAAYFHQLGWSIHCFEPDSKNRERLNARFGKSPNITIDTRAVSDKPAKSVSFYTSPESTGISGLHAFRNTHTKSDTVDVTTVEEIIASRQLSTVDFLKIDVEGFDFAVLKGVPWNRIKPDVVECEYEDAKTVKMGHTWKDVAEFLREKGYAVYLSEWHPIVRYGVAHDWRRIVKFPGVELPSDSWGNILAFREDPGLEVVSAAFDKKMTFRSVSNSSHLSAKNTKANSEIQESRANMLQKTNRTSCGRYHSSRFLQLPSCQPSCHRLPHIAPGCGFRSQVWVWLPACSTSLSGRIRTQPLYISKSRHFAERRHNFVSRQLLDKSCFQRAAALRQQTSSIGQSSHT